MHPTLATYHLLGQERVIPSYGAMLALAIVLSSALVVRAAMREGIDVGKTFALIAITIGAAFLGGNVLFVLVEWARTGEFATALTTGGRVLYGSLLGGFAAFLVFAKKLGLPRARLLDLSVPAIALAHALGRVGCFLAGCCFGAPHDGALSVTATDALAPAAHPSVARHPVALYEAFAMLAVALVASLWPLRRDSHGRRFMLYVIVYAAVRFALEALRGDVVRGLVFGVSTSQWLALLLCIVTLVLHSRQSRCVPSSSV